MSAALAPELEALVQAVDLTDDELKEAAKKATASVHRLGRVRKVQ
jgi:hypothetical protein